MKIFSYFVLFYSAGNAIDLTIVTPSNTKRGNHEPTHDFPLIFLAYRRLGPPGMHDRPPKEAKSATEAELFKRPGDAPYKPSGALRRLGRLPVDRRHYLLVQFDGDGLAA